MARERRQIELTSASSGAASTALPGPVRIARPAWIGSSWLVSGAGVLALLGVVLGSAAIVLAAAQGGSRYMSPYLHHGGPLWMAGPLGGVWPGRPASSAWLQHAVLIALLIMLACYLVGLASVRRIPTAVLWTAVGAAHLVALASPPLLLTDVFNYEQYARMGALHGLNPYTHLPVAASADPVFALTTWTHMPSVYGPLFTLVTYALVPLGVAGSLWAFKVLLSLGSLALLVLVWLLAGRLGRNPKAAVLLCGLNPLVLVYGLGGGHNDVLAMVPVLAAVLFLADRREMQGAAAMVVAVSLKASALVLAPVVLLAAGRWRRTAAGGAAAAIVLGGATLLAFGPHLPAVGDQSRLVAELSIPNTIGYLLGLGGETATVRAVAQAVLVLGTIAISVWVWRSRQLLAGLGWVTLILLVTLGWDMPWYLIWLLPFMALLPSRRFRVSAGLVVVWMTLQWLPTMPRIARDSVGLAPSRTALFCHHQLAMYQLLGRVPIRHGKPPSCSQFTTEKARPSPLPEAAAFTAARDCLSFSTTRTVCEGFFTRRDFFTVLAR